MSITKKEASMSTTHLPKLMSGELKVNEVEKK